MTFEFKLFRLEEHAMLVTNLIIDQMYLDLRRREDVSEVEIKSAPAWTRLTWFDPDKYSYVQVTTGDYVDENFCPVDVDGMTEMDEPDTHCTTHPKHPTGLLP